MAASLTRSASAPALGAGWSRLALRCPPHRPERRRFPSVAIGSCAAMAWSEIVAIIWSALFVLSVAIMTHNEERPSHLASGALLFAAGSVLALFGVVLKGTL